MIKNRGCLIEVEIILGNNIVGLIIKLNHKYKIRHLIDYLSNATYSIYFYLFGVEKTLRPFHPVFTRVNGAQLSGGGCFVTDFFDSQSIW